VHGAGLEHHDEEDHVADQATPGQHLGREKVRGRQAVPMRRQECLPRCLRAALWGRLDTVVLEDGLDRVSPDFVTKVLQPAADAGVPVVRQYSDRGWASPQTRAV